MFQFGIDRQVFYIVMAILVIMSLGRYLTDTNAL